jgi:ABC-type branched-subunit amino acid transport system ATPase component
MALALTVEDLRSGYGETEILHGITFAVEPAETYALVGKNGAGKTTLLKSILGVLRTTSGKVTVFGNDISKSPAHKIAVHSVAYAPQETAFFPDLSVQDNVRLGAMRLSKDEFHERRARVIELFPFLGKRMRQPAGTLSGGEQKMLNVARALLPSPKLVFLDEVSEGLQPSVIDRIQEALAAEQEASRLTIVIVEQNLDFVLRLASHYALIERGNVAARGSMADADAKAAIEEHLTI